MPHYYGIRLGSIGFFILLFILCHSLSDSLNSPFNCTMDSISGDLMFPTLELYDAADAEPNYTTNGIVILNPPLKEPNVLGWIGLECSHSKPVRWVYDLNIVESGLGDTYSVTQRDVGDFYDEGTYMFRADVELQIYARNLNFIMACAAFDNPCEKKVVHVSYDNKKKRYILMSINRDENLPLVTELELAILKSTNWGQAHPSSSSCTVNFSFFDEGELKYHHVWVPQFGNKIKPRAVPDRQTLENAYLYAEHLNQICVTDQCKHDDDFKACNNVPKEDKAKYWPLVFFMTDGKNISRAAYAYHTLISRNNNGQNNPGRLKLAWEYSNPTDFLDLAELPNLVYLGQEITVTCLVSQFLFSFGTQIGFLSNISNTDKITFMKDIIEDTEIGATRVATRQITFPSTYVNSKITIYCFSPIWNSSTEWVNISREFELIESKLEVNGTGNKLFVLPVNSAFSTSCTASGFPLPDFELVLPANSTRVNLNETEKDNSRQITIIITTVDESHAGFYNCVASNSKGTSFYEFEIQIESLSVSEATMSTLTIALISVFGSVSAIFLIVVIVLVVKFHMEKAEFRRLTEEAVREFFEGLDIAQVSTGDGSDQHSYANDSVKVQPYNKEFEVHRKHWSLSSTVLGSGAFGTVRKGVVEIGSRKSVVAVKTSKSRDDIDDFKATLLELKIMSTIGHHRHIVKLIAASTDEIHNRKVFIGVELCANGSLLTYLQKRKKLFTNLVRDGRIQFQPNNKTENTSSEEQVGAYINLVVTSDISTIDLFKWSFQIASGMDFLESKKVLHADLAARNVLLTEDLLAKISDFGMSRELFENSEYTKKTQVVLPWKWMAIESLRELKFSSKSDVWSYGITLYEVFTLGDEPYPGQIWNDEFITTLENGMRMNCPPFCTENVYNHVMMLCWRNEPNDRIRFADAMSFFEKAIGLLTSSRNGQECRDFC